MVAMFSFLSIVLIGHQPFVSELMTPRSLFCPMLLSLYSLPVILPSILIVLSSWKIVELKVRQFNVEHIGLHVQTQGETRVVVE